MKTWRCGWAALSLTLVAGIVSGYGQTTGKQEKKAEENVKPGKVTAYVAASTTNAVEAIAASFTKETGIEVAVQPGGSDALAQDIISGKPSDVFISADVEWAGKVKDKSLVQETTDLLSNKLVIVVPKDNPAKVKSPEDLVNLAAVKKVALAGDKVPAGMYAEQSLSALKLYDKLSAVGKILRGEDVRATLALVEDSKAEAGIVYDTDGKESEKVEIIYTFDDKTHEKIVYPLQLLNKGGSPEGGKMFYDYLKSDKATKEFVKAGFIHLAVRMKAAVAQPQSH